MEAVRRCSHLLALSCLVSRIVTSRVPCGAHQNVDAWGPRFLTPLQMTSPPIIFPFPNPMSLPPAPLPHLVPDAPRPPCSPRPQKGLGSGPNQPNVITQSVTWSASKKGAAKPTTTIETDCPTEDFIIDSPEKSMRIVHPARRKCRAECADCDLDCRLKRLVEILDGLQARESDLEAYNRRTRSSRMRKPKWMRRYVDEYEDDEEYPTKDEEYAFSEEIPERRRRPRRRMQKICDFDEPEEELEPVRKRAPKMDWLVLKKVPKKGAKRYLRDEEDPRRDYSVESGPRDVLYLPPCDSKDKYRRRDSEYDR